MPKLYEALADAFLAEGVDTQFVLMGDGNMHWSTAFAKLPGVHTVHVGTSTPPSRRRRPTTRRPTRSPSPRSPAAPA